VVELLRERKDAGHAVIKLAQLAAVWQENEGRSGVAKYWGTNAKFRRLKDAVSNGKIKGTRRPNEQSEGDVDDLIRYFREMD